MGQIAATHECERQICEALGLDVGADNVQAIVIRLQANRVVTATIERYVTTPEYRRITEILALFDWKLIPDGSNDATTDDSKVMARSGDE